MLTPSFVIARKELLEHARDVRSLVSTALYTLMGPLVIGLVSLARGGAAASSPGPVPIMAAVFAIAAAFTGGMSLAMDTIAGERERRSLLPLLLNSVSRREIILGKWLAAGVFAVIGSLLNLVAFGVVLASSRGWPGAAKLGVVIPALVALGLLAAALEILVSTACRNVKEAHTCLSLLLFAAMGVSMWLAFRSHTAEGWWSFLPMAGQQRLLESYFKGRSLPAVHSAMLTLTTAASAWVVVLGTGKLFQRDASAYGN